MTRWRNGEWWPHRAEPEVRAVAFEVGDWAIYLNGRRVALGDTKRSQRAAKRAAERWVERFARELLISAGKESP